MDVVEAFMAVPQFFCLILICFVCTATHNNEIYENNENKLRKIKKMAEIHDGNDDGRKKIFEIIKFY